MLNKFHRSAYSKIRLTRQFDTKIFYYSSIKHNMKNKQKKRFSDLIATKIFLMLCDDSIYSLIGRYFIVDILDISTICGEKISLKLDLMWKEEKNTLKKSVECGKMREL